MHDEKDFTFILIEVAIVPPSGLIEHLKDRWWIVHPEKGLPFYKGFAPQCNSNEILTRRLSKNFPWNVRIQFIPSVFHSINPHDYC